MLSIILDLCPLDASGIQLRNSKMSLDFAKSSRGDIWPTLKTIAMESTVVISKEISRASIQLADLQTLSYQSDSILAHFHIRWEMPQRTNTQVNFREKKFQT